jgi:hypothetical protein
LNAQLHNRKRSDGTLAKYGCEYVRRRKLCGKLEPGGTEEFQEDVTRQALDVFWMFLASYSAVHVNFELQYWLTDERGIFNKYEMAEGQAGQLQVAKKVYFTKASWVFALVKLNAFGLNFRTAMALSFFIYGIELVLLFPARM